MRGLLVPFLAVLAAGVAAWLLIAYLRRRSPSAETVRDDVAKVLAAHGAGRCLEATRLLRALGERGPAAEIPATWQALELPLLQALPDCPPDYKLELANALDACARACRKVEVAKDIVTMRNALIG